MLFTAVSSFLKTRAALQLENVALRHQIGVLQRSAKKRPRLNASDRFLWVWLSQVWTDWRSALVIVKPRTHGIPDVLDVEDPEREDAYAFGQLQKRDGPQNNSHLLHAAA